MTLRDKLKFWILLSSYVEMIVRGTSPLSLPNAIADSLEYLKAFGGTKQGLPDGYTQLEYIESTGTQYIDTGIGLNSAYKYRLVVASVNGNNASNIWGYKSNASYTGGPCCIIGWTGSPTTYIGAYNKNGTITGAFPTINSLRWTAGTFFDILLDVTQSNFSVNDTNYYSTSGVSTVLTTDSWTDTHHPYLFGTQTVDSAMPSSAIRIKTYQVRDTNGVLIQNFVPCKNESNVIGMYDTVSQTFFTNAGTGTFTAGGEAVPTPDAPMDIVSNNGALKARHQSGLPLGYTLLEYIASTGTQYIDTGIVPNVTTRVVAKIAFPDVFDAVLCWGSRSSGTYNTSLDQFYCGRTGSSLWYYSATTQTNIRSGISPNVFYDIDVTNTRVTATATQSIYLFALNNIGTATPDSSSKIAKFEIYNNSALVCNLVPARRNSDNVLGLYDLVSGQFLTNAGTGTFTAGNTVSDPIEIYADSASKNLLNKNGTFIEFNSAADYIAIPVKNGTYTCSTNIPLTGPTDANAWFDNQNTTFSSTTNPVSSSAKRTVTTSNGYVYFAIRKSYKSGLLDGTYWVQVEQGSSATPYAPYRNTTETIEMFGKNILNPNDWMQNKAVVTGASNAGEVIDYNDWSTTNFIAVRPSTQYTWSTGSTRNKLFHFYNADGTYISSSNQTSSETVTRETPAGAAKMRLQINAVGSSLTNLNQQLELGSTATTYEPYTVFGTATAEMLLKVGNYEDVQSIIDGAITRNVGVKVLDGTEDWTYNNYAFLVDLIGRLPQKHFMFCTHFNYDSGSSTTIPNLCIGGAGTTNTIFIKYQTYNTAEQFKQYLADQYAAGTPVIIVYPLAAPTTESVAGQALNTQQGDNIVEITQASLDNLELEAKYKKQA